MKTLNRFLIFLLLVVSSHVFMGCDAMLDVDSTRMVTDEEYGNSTKDTLYSTFGILSQMQKIADSYVLLGELRGDLLDVTEISDLHLKEINNFNISKDNPYVNVYDYYAIVNSCNYLLHNIDSAVVDRGQKLNLRHYAAIKSIRAWTYMQIVLNFGTVNFSEKPVLSVKDADFSNVMNFDQLADALIVDLEPLKDVELPNIGRIGSYDVRYSYFPIRFLLGDLYLWKGEYQKAAQEYYNLIYENNLTLSQQASSSWNVINNTIGTSAILNWNSVLTLGGSDVISAITCPTQYGQRSDLDSLNMQMQLRPTAQALANWDNQIYFLSEQSNSVGDLRKYGSVWWMNEVNVNSGNTNIFYKGDDEAEHYYIMKYMRYRQNETETYRPLNIPVYRVALLYLRYAEAVNRLNKPNLAFAVLKTGLSSQNFADEIGFLSSEIDSISLSYTDFSDLRFYDNAGVRMRGLGNTQNDTTFYRFATQANMQDSVLYVENLIEQELALETAFEGNRFHDLMRIAFRRMKTGEGDESYLADKVAAKHVNNQSAIRTKLLNSQDWYIKTGN
ncbi:MAG: RagB/SusD family nutrient uptake outer membrane protein [Paludibacteraceae bacterium]|nr:RagB/SusD family nutrient uptake outer membrane protein [Paludibacteraceae bacterium]